MGMQGQVPNPAGVTLLLPPHTGPARHVGALEVSWAPPTPLTIPRPLPG